MYDQLSLGAPGEGTNENTEDNAGFFQGEAIRKAAFQWIDQERFSFTILKVAHAQNEINDVGHDHFMRARSTKECKANPASAEGAASLSVYWR